MIKVRQLKINVEDDSLENLKLEVIKKLKIKSSDITNFKIIKRSIDARKKPLIYYIYEVNLSFINEDFILENTKDINVLKTEETNYQIGISGNKKMNNVCIIGSGPSGLMCAYNLAKLGFNPTIFERGKEIEKRVEDVNLFWEKGILNESSNIQFGEGGAGTFSDGKLNTLIKDKENRCKYVFELFVKCGAPEEILYDYKPHIGTDLLRNVIINLREEIKALGGKFNYSSELTDVFYDNEEICGIEINNKEYIKTNCVVLAIGHSARDTYRMLYDKKINMEQKPFAVGLRIMHSQELINLSQIGVKKHSKLLEQSYKLTYTTKDNNGVYSFCMCPGGYVVNASSERNKLVINGMSNHSRESGIANSAIVVTINQSMFNNKDVFSGIKFQEELESKTYNLLNGIIPVQMYKDYKDNIKTNNYKSIKPEIKGKYGFTNLRGLLPDNLENNLVEAIEYFGSKIKGFSSSDALLCAIESRTSSPLRILRNDDLESSVNGLYPIGEGAGYAGGITSSAIDGLKASEKIASKYYI